MPHDLRTSRVLTAALILVVYVAASSYLGLTGFGWLMTLGAGSESKAFVDAHNPSGDWYPATLAGSLTSVRSFWTPSLAADAAFVIGSAVAGLLALVVFQRSGRAGVLLSLATALGLTWVTYVVSLSLLPFGWAHQGAAAGWTVIAFGFAGLAFASVAPGLARLLFKDRRRFYTSGLGFLVGAAIGWASAIVMTNKLIGPRPLPQSASVVFSIAFPAAVVAVPLLLYWLGSLSSLRILAVGSATVAVLLMAAIGGAMVLSNVQPNTPSAPPVSVEALRQRPLTIPSTCLLTPPSVSGSATVYESDTYSVRTLDARTNVLQADFFNKVMFHLVEHEDAIIRGRLIGGDDVVWFESNSHGDPSRSISRSSDGTTRYFVDEYEFRGNGNTAYATIWVDTAGCYVLQFDGARGTQKIVVAFR